MLDKRGLAVKCSFCDRMAWLPQYVRPVMCLKHHDAVRIVAQLQRQGERVTIGTIVDLYRRQLWKHVVAPEELPGLLAGILTRRLS